MALKLGLLEQLASVGLPRPEREVKVCDGRKWRWDYFWGEPYRVVIEYQGGTWHRGGHTRGKQYRSDCEKMAEGQLQGFIVIWVTADMVEDGTAMEIIERAFKARKETVKA